METEQGLGLCSVMEWKGKLDGSCRAMIVCEGERQKEEWRGQPGGETHEHAAGRGR